MDSIICHLRVYFVGQNYDICVLNDLGNAYKILGCAGLTRVDFLIDGETGKTVLNEPNTLPGFTNISMYPKLIMDTGMSYAQLIDRLLELAVS